MSRTIAGLALCLLTFISAACDRMPLTAPTDSTIVLNINTTTIPLNGTAEITAIVTESGGTPPQNGTVVTFATTLGSIDPFEARTHNGRASARLLAGNRSGTAEVRAFSGGAETEALEIRIGGANIGRITLRPESASADGTRVSLVATVFDDAGNVVPGVPVSFETTAGQVSPGVATSDNNGEARATLTTSQNATVTARAGGESANATFQVAAPGSIALAVTTPTPPASAEVGQTVTFTVTPAANFFFSDLVVDFGDGQTQNFGPLSAVRTFTHIYNARGTYNVIARATSANGPTSASTTVTVTERAPLQVGLTAAPNPVPLTGVRGVTVLTAQVTAPLGTTVTIASVEWDFGDNTPIASGTSLTINHQYPPQAPKSYIATVRVRTTDGREGSASTTVVVTP